MRAMVKQRLGFGLVFLTALFAAADCDNGDTVVAVNVSYDSTAMDVQSGASSLHITVSPHAGGQTPVTADVQLMRDDAGAITTLAYKRVTVNGWSGMVDVTVEARDSGGSTLLSAMTTADLVEHGAVAAYVNFARMMPDAGDTSGSGGSEGGGTGGDSGSGGAVGSGGATAAGSGGQTAMGGATGSGGA